MTIEGAIQVGEKVQADLAAKKEADRIAALTPEQKTAEEAKAAEAKKAEENKALLEKPDEELDDNAKAQKQTLIEGQKKAEEAEEARIIAAKDDELAEDELQKKAEILKKREEDKILSIQRKTQERIDEIHGELKAEKAGRIKDREKIEALEAELKKVTGAHQKPVIETEVKKLEATRVSKLIEEDKALPKDQRREMTRDDLEEWLAEDIVAAQEWLADRAVRRDRERSADLNRLNKTDEPGAESRKKAEAILTAQAVSRKKVEAKHPELNVTARIQALKAEGKTEKEIQAVIFKENPKARIVAEILKEEDGEKYLFSENGPELLAAEMEKRLKPNDKGETQEERDARIGREAIEAEAERQSKIPAHLRGKPGDTNGEKMNELEQAQWVVYQKTFPKKTIKDFREMLERRKNNSA